MAGGDPAQAPTDELALAAAALPADLAEGLLAALRAQQQRPDLRRPAPPPPAPAPAPQRPAPAPQRWPGWRPPRTPDQLRAAAQERRARWAELYRPLETLTIPRREACALYDAITERDPRTHMDVGLLFPTREAAEAATRSTA